MVCEKLGEEKYPELNNCRFNMVGHNDGYALGEGKDRKVPFVVYENGPPLVEDDIGWGDVPDVPPIMLQVIGHKDDRLRTEPVAFLECFDYGLVRGLFDPSNMAFVFHDSLQETLVSREILYNNQKTLNRINNFLTKMRISGENGMKLVSSFKTVDIRPKERSLLKTPFTLMSDGLVENEIIAYSDFANEWRIVD